jgi:PAS domain-containing protein
MEEKETLRQAKQEAEARANQMASIFEAMADGVVVYDCDGRIQYTNTAFRALFALNTDADPALLPHDEQAVRAVLRDLGGRTLSQDQWPRLQIARGECLSDLQTMDLICRDGKGQDLFLNVSRTPICDAAGQAVGSVAVYRDVTERHRLEQQLQYAEQKFRSLVESNIVGVMVTDQTGRMYEVNNRLVQLLDYSRDELLSENTRVKDLLAEEYHSARARAWKTLLSPKRRSTCVKMGVDSRPW